MHLGDVGARARARSTCLRTLGKGWTPPDRSGPSWPLSSGRTSRCATSSTSPRARIQWRAELGQAGHDVDAVRGVGVGPAGVVEDDRRLARRGLEVDGAHRDAGSPTWILREPRIGPVVTLSSVRAGASPILTPLPTPVSAGSGSSGSRPPAHRTPPLSRVSRLPGEDLSLGPRDAARQTYRPLGGASAGRRVARDEVAMLGHPLDGAVDPLRDCGELAGGVDIGPRIDQRVIAARLDELAHEHREPARLLEQLGRRS